ncbi:Hypothetical protein NTJ_04915 [Nesidiocoris tenuis]|uniref:THAP-type domain-containing protein n=1 Tax=Nesidiocoris tenuis TaxID=355587 RepID=A0ABN7ANY9_9HEMI|nr:Hypothetical protein NTJ_04915 [Nesidiocoris tenuis]
MFTVPKEENIRKVWIQFCGRVDKFNPDTARVCSNHFTMDDFEDAIQSKIMGRYPRRLKKSAVPTVRPNPENSEKRQKMNEGDSSCETLELVYDDNRRLLEAADMESESSDNDDGREPVSMKKFRKLEAEKNELESKLNQSEELKNDIESKLKKSENKVSELRSISEALLARIDEQEDQIRSLQEYAVTLKKSAPPNDHAVERKIASILKGLLKKKEVIVVLRRH